LQHLETHTRFVKAMATELGFDFCGIAKARMLDDDARRLETWLNKGMNGQMQYMANHFDKRVDPTKLLPGAKSVITLLLNYYPQQQQPEGVPQISKYAYGKDYHEVIREKLNHFLYRLREVAGQFEGRGFVDSAPVLERSWAVRSGAGFVGKSGNLINRRMGSFFFIATLIIDLPLLYDDPFAGDYCGSCTRCIDACPTDAILPNKVVDGSKCISYFTIELKEMLLPGEMQGRFADRMFGCDTCQDVCPWNRFSKPTQEAGFEPIAEILSFTAKDWKELTEEKFKVIFSKSPLKRSKYAGIRRNLQFIG
jgi:epoxyqueuosine reductase